MAKECIHGDDETSKRREEKRHETHERENIEV